MFDNLIMFLNAMIADPRLLIAVLLTLGVILVNGWTDAPNAIATCVVTRCMSERAAIIMAAICNFFGVLIMFIIGDKVATTISNMVDIPDDNTAIIALCAAMFAIVLWATLAWVFGIPTSESHALIAGLTGSALAVVPFSTLGEATSIGDFFSRLFVHVKLAAWGDVLIGIVVSILLGFGLGYGVCKLLTVIFRNADRRRTEPFFKSAQIFGAGAMAFMHGAQDGLKFMGIIMLAFKLSGGVISENKVDLWWMMLLCSLIMAGGTAIGGKKIIKSVGMDMVKLEKYQGFSADIASALALAFCSFTGLPVSTTHAKTISIMGVGAVRNIKAINFGVVKEMCLTWILTFPGCALVGYIVTKVFLWVSSLIG